MIVDGIPNYAALGVIILIQFFLRNEYVTMKQQWQSITPQQEKNFSVLRERKHLVGKIELVWQTDQTG